MTNVPKIIREKVKEFERDLVAYKSTGYKEERVKIDFINPFFEALGWKVGDTTILPQYRDVIFEDSIKVVGGTKAPKAPDYCFTLSGKRMFFVEAKKPSVNIKEDFHPAYQIRRYAWSANLPVSVLTDFEEFAVYESRTKPKKDDKAYTERIMYFTFRDYVDKWDEISSIFSRDAVHQGSLDRFIEATRKKRGTVTVDDAFLSEIETWREMFAKNIALRNPDISVRELNYAVRETIDRIIFLRMCEDRGVENYSQLQSLVKDDNIYSNLCEIYKKADAKYNSGLFHFKNERGRATDPDILTLKLNIDDKVFRTIINHLYYPDSPYEFSVLPSEILGQVYEQFLGKIIRLTPSHRAKVEEKPENNDFLIASQFWITGEMHTRRTDLIGFVNGIPLVFIELKASHRLIKNAYDQNLRDYKDTIPHLFWYNGLIILSNGSKTKVGSITAGWEHFSEWKKINSEGEEGIISLETVIRGTCEKNRLLDIVENFTLFMEVQGGNIKLVAKNHQYLGVSNIIDALKDIESAKGKLGVFWHTQGSGKSISMIFFSQKILRKVPGNWTFVVVTDRQELDTQIYKNFVSTGAITEKEAQAENIIHLRQLLREDHRFVFTLIHKFQEREEGEHPILSKRKDIIVITDEAHRSQYDTLAMNMRTALPNASFIAFTGTPLIVGEEKTRDVFGDYVSIYNYTQSTEDNATVPIYYENRIPELQLKNPELNNEMEELLDSTMLDENQERKLEKEFSRQYHLITREDRLNKVSEDIVAHFMGRGYSYKAMVVCIDKATAIRTYDKVRKYWNEHLEELKKDLQKVLGSKVDEIKDKIRFMEETDMAVVVSQSQNEIDEMRKKGLDIKPHRKRIIEEDLDTKFKDPEDTFRIVFVCAMWMTGFDVPCCSTIYLDKPMRNHTLMQTIARANRVFQDKVNGLIVDYVGVFRNLEKALAIYGSGSGGGVKEGDVPAIDKKKLVTILEQTIEETAAFCSNTGISIEDIESAEGFEKIRLVDEAVDLLLVNDETKKKFLSLAATTARLYKAILPDPRANELGSKCILFRVLAKKIRNLNPPADISDIMGEVEDLLDRSIEAEGYIIDKPTSEEETDHLLDLSKIDFDALREKFESGRKRTEIERIRALTERKLRKMISLNKARMNYLEKFKEMIEEYNSGSLSAEELFNRLTDFIKSLEEEEKRTIKENLSEEELTIFDILTKPEIDLSEKERQQVKKVARDLLKTLKWEKLVIDWRKKQQSRAGVKLAIEKTLDGLPESYSTEIYKQKCEFVYQHVYDSYYGPGQSVYTAVA